ncbi:MAG: choice-of-anchor D domain-containing protein [Deltaproteobacteria bacterium]|nr:choice-of-anchor D domain-containing protein [Deltaproteobacteria bacterium]
MLAKHSPRYLPLFFLGALVRCECDEPQEFRPAATYQPGDVLDFGVVSVRSEKTLPIKVTSNGRAALTIDFLASTIDPESRDARVTPDVGPFLVLFSADLESLAPGRSSTIAVTYRPCPAAWEGGWDGARIKDGFDFGTCPDRPEQVTFTVRDNTRQTETEGGIPIQISGRPGQPPALDLVCQAGRGHCNELPDLASALGCVSLTFGEVNAAGMPCDLALEVRNKKRNGKDTGDLVIERMEILVFDAQDPNQALRSGAEVGFSVLDESGTPLLVDSDHPLVVGIPVGQAEGKKRLTARFSGSTPGDWVGAQGLNGGLRVYSNDPDAQPVKSVLVSGSGTAPDIQVLHPGKIDFGSVQQGRTATGSAIVRNNGNAQLSISDVRIRGASGVFSVSTPRGTSFLLDPAGTGNNTVEVNVTYSPSGSGFDADAVVVASNDVDTPILAIPLSGGAVPQISVEPSPTLVFPLPNPPDGRERPEELVVSNVGYGDLEIQRLLIVGPAPEEDPMHSSVNDFTIQGCTANPCPQSEVLCAPGSPGCAVSAKTYTIVYKNDDASQTDLVSLKISTNDPVNPEWTVVLSANDVPCLFPTPVITVETPSNERKVGDPIIVSGTSSTPGSGTSIVDYRWDFAFAPAAFPVITEVTPGDKSRISFVPGTTGLYILGLDVTNNCGAASQRTKTERINVAPQ